VAIIIEAPPDTIRRQTPTPESEWDVLLRPEFDVPPTRAADVAADVIEWPPTHPVPPDTDRPALSGSATTDPRRLSIAVGRMLRPAVVLRLWAAALAAGVTVGTVIEPVPDGPEPVAPPGIQIAGNATVILLLTAFAALLAGRRWGLGAATYGSAGLVVLSALCPTTGHHTLDAWWFWQLAISVGLLAGSMALRSRLHLPRRASGSGM
jgi:hypothetical protein